MADLIYAVGRADDTDADARDVTLADLAERVQERIDALVPESDGGRVFLKVEALLRRVIISYPQACVQTDPFVLNNLPPPSTTAGLTVAKGCGVRGRHHRGAAGPRCL